MRALGPVVDTIQPKAYLAMQRMNDDAMDWGHRFYMKSGFMPSLPDQAVQAGIDQVSRAPGDCTVSVWAWGRVIGRVPEDATAFTGRGAAFWVSVEALWDDAEADDAHVGWGRAAMAALTPSTTVGAYVNDQADTGDDVVRSVYGDAKYERLVALKRAWDPDNVFRLNQNVRP